MKPPSRRLHSMTAKPWFESTSVVLLHRLLARLRSCFNGQFRGVTKHPGRTLGNRDEGHSKHIRRGFVNRPARINQAKLTRTDRSRWDLLKLLRNWHRLATK